MLKRMYVAKNITKEQYEKAIKHDITKDFAKQSKRSRDTYPYVYDLAEREATKIMTKYLMKQDGVKEDEVKPSELAEVRANYQDQALVALRQGGYKVHMTLDKKFMNRCNNLRRTMGTSWWHAVQTSRRSKNEKNRFETRSRRNSSSHGSE